MDEITWCGNCIGDYGACAWALQQRIRAIVCRSGGDCVAMRTSNCGNHGHPVTRDLSGHEARHLSGNSTDMAMMGPMASQESWCLIPGPRSVGVVEHVVTEHIVERICHVLFFVFVEVVPFIIPIIVACHVTIDAGLDEGMVNYVACVMRRF